MGGEGSLFYRKPVSRCKSGIITESKAKTQDRVCHDRVLLVICRIKKNVWPLNRIAQHDDGSNNS